MKTLRKKKQSEEQYQSAVQEAFWASISRLDYNAARDLVTKIHDADARLNARRRLQLMCVNLGRIDWAVEITPFAGRNLTEGDYFNCARAAAEVGEVESFVVCIEALDGKRIDRGVLTIDWIRRMLETSSKKIEENYGYEVLFALQNIARIEAARLDHSYWLKRLVSVYSKMSQGLPLDIRVALLPSSPSRAYLRDLCE